jgi:hypothetical protein
MPACGGVCGNRSNSAELVLRPGPLYSDGDWHSRRGTKAVHLSDYDERIEGLGVDVLDGSRIFGK